ncbi:DUF2510 domain-containing protein [Agromyces sp. G08B096]|uniref:DUF2510 domain-containing protein n=1 Tax=Agromyces sp. G08B096 TaxID=3156399 RepID=A0AAU7W7P1_9MICO
MSDPNATPAGWYDDGSGTGTLRYWDGSAWTEHRMPAPPAAAPDAAAVPPVESAPAAAVPPVESAPAGVGAPAGFAAPAGATAQVGTGVPAYAAGEASAVPPVSPYGSGYPGAPVPPGGSAPQQSRKPHVLGIIALAVAAVGFIFACIPGALIVGWVLLPIAFVLSIVALFLKGAKWPAITGLAVSIVGTIVGVIVFVVVASNAFSDAVDGTTGGSSSSELPAEESDAPEEPVEQPAETLAFGDTMVYEDDVELNVSAPAPYTPSEYAAGADQAANIVFTMTITNNSTENLDPLPMPQLSSGGQEASEIFDFTADGTDIGLPPTNVLLPGQSVTWQSAWSVADPASLTLQVAPGFLYEDAIFTNVQ